MEKITDLQADEWYQDSLKRFNGNLDYALGFKTALMYATGTLKVRNTDTDISVVDSDSCLLCAGCLANPMQKQLGICGKCIKTKRI